MEQRNQITFYRSYFEAISALPKKDQLAVYQALLAYGLDGTEPALSGVQASIFCLIKPTLDASKKKSAAGKLGGSTKQTASKPQANRKQTASEKEEEGEKEGEKENECYPPTPLPGEKKTGFVKPSVDEVMQYCIEHGCGIDPQHFVDYYTANGWKVGKNPMKDWKAAVRTWEKNQNPVKAKSFADIARDGL